VPVVSDLPAPRLELVTRVEATLGPIVSLGRTPWGERRVVAITGGRLDGPRLRGRIVPGGADWQVVHADGMISVDARYTFETDDGAVIYVQSQGVRDGTPEVLAALAAGESVDPCDYYFRASIRLETGAPAYDWVNRRIFIASAQRLPAGVAYDLFAVG
jgi:hypothetical protein